MKNITRALAIAVGLALAAQAYAGDAQDTKTEKTAEARKAARNVKGATVGKSASDRAEDAKDTANETAAKARKSGRKTARRVDKAAHDATK